MVQEGLAAAQSSHPQPQLSLSRLAQGSQGASSSEDLPLASSVLPAGTLLMGQAGPWFGVLGRPLELAVSALLGLRISQTGLAHKW